MLKFVEDLVTVMKRVRSKRNVEEEASSGSLGVFPPVSEVVNVDFLDYVSSLLDISEISKIVNARIVKLRPRVYVVKSRGSLTPHLVYMALSFCRTYVYYSLALGGQVVTEFMLRVMARGVLAHRAYARALRERLRGGGIVVEEVEVEGDLFGVDMRGRIDLVAVVNGDVRVDGRNVSAIGDVYVCEVKTSRKVTEGQVAQVVTYRRLLDLDCVPVVIARDKVHHVDDVEARDVLRKVKCLLRELSTASYPPQPETLERCRLCPLRYGICVYGVRARRLREHSRGRS